MCVPKLTMGLVDSSCKVGHTVIEIVKSLRPHDCSHVVESHLTWNPT
jgi:hypothetical protein